MHALAARLSPDAAGMRQASLPYGLRRDGRVTRHVTLRALEGPDEMALCEALEAGETPAVAASRLLAACVLLDGQPLGLSGAEALVLGDREVLLRALHAASFGARVELVQPCAAGCGETIEFAVDLDTLTQPVPEPGPEHRRDLGGVVVPLRLPSGRDLTRAVQTGDAQVLVQAAAGDAPVARAALAAALAELDPNAECALSLTCPACGAGMTHYLDAMSLLARAVRRGGGLFRQIDLLARTYGWSEDEILALPRARRLRYCAMVAEAGR
jgi:hypothetical protein